MQSSDHVRNAAERAADAMIIVDASGAILFSNREAGALFGYEADEIAGRHFDFLLPDPETGSGIPQPQALGNGSSRFARRSNGSEFPAEISVSELCGSSMTLLAASIREVTGGRALSDSSNQAKSRFLATASHDLRQPLQTLALLNGALTRMVNEPEPLEALMQQEQAINAMSRLLNALLDISKLESGAIKPEVTDFTVVELFAELRSEFAGLAALKGLKLEVEACDDCVQSDASLIEQILRNLVSNAIKYTHRGFVHLRCLRDRTFVRLEVLDSGIGMPVNALAHIYDEFYQVGVSSNTTRDGYGLGLSIVSRIVDLLGHTLEVRSEPGRGSTFSLVLPLGRRSQVHRSTPDSSKRTEMATAASPHILLVEDDAGVREATRLLLTVAGFRVTAATSLAEVLAHASEHADIALVIADYHLSNEETGLQVIGAVRQQLAPDLRAILMTGDTSSAMQLIRHDNHLRVTSKPIKADELLGLLRELLDG